MTFLSTDGPEREERCVCRDCGHVHTSTEREELFEYNITHNLGQMAHAAELYLPLWRPDENGITTASHLVEFVAKYLAACEENPEAAVRVSR